MAYPTSVNGQITDFVTQAHTAGGDAALTSITALLETIAQSLNVAQANASSSQPKSGLAERLSTAFAKAESELQEVRSRLESAAGE